MEGNIASNEINETECFSCDKCQNVYSSKSGFLKHMRTHGEMKYTCAFCPKRYFQEQDLKHHEMLHTGERPNKCNVCPKSFIQKSALNKHLKIHGEKEFVCTYCPKGFFQMTNLQNHEKFHTGQHSYECTVCNKKFIQITNFKSHKRKYNHWTNHPEEFKKVTEKEDKLRKVKEVNEKYKNRILKEAETKLKSKNDLVVGNISEVYSRSKTRKKDADKLHRKAIKEEVLLQTSDTNVETHLSQSTCGICGKYFESEKFLQKHLDMGHKKYMIGEKIFQCNKCQKRFKTKDDCKNHVCENTKEFKLEETEQTINNLEEMDGFSDIYDEINDKEESKLDNDTRPILENYENHENINKYVTEGYDDLESKSGLQHTMESKSYSSLETPEEEIINVLENSDISLIDIKDETEDLNSLENNYDLKSRNKTKTSKLQNPKNRNMNDAEFQNNLEYNYQSENGVKSVAEDPMEIKKALTEGEDEDFALEKKNTKNVENQIIKSESESDINDGDEEYFDIGTKSNIKDENPEIKPEVMEEDFATIKTELSHSVGKNVKFYECAVCGKILVTKYSLNEHQRVHTGEKPYKCDSCDKAYSSKSGFVGHKRIHTGEKPYQCHICGREFSLWPSLYTHKQIHNSQKRYQCDECDKSFSTKYSFTNHKRLHTGDKPHLCDLCEKSFTHIRALKVHKLIHSTEKPYLCDGCEKAFASHSSLIKHQSIHSDEKPFQCNICGYATRINQSYKHHMMWHTGDLKFKCDQCDFQSVTSTRLNDHKRKHSGEKPHICDMCGKAYSQKSDLTIHIRSHTGVKYGCEICSKAFLDTSTVRKHAKRVHNMELLKTPVKMEFGSDQKYHNDEKISKREDESFSNMTTCQQCGKYFANVKFLEKHIAMGHKKSAFGKKITQCINCQKCFESVEELKQHICEK